MSSIKVETFSFMPENKKRILLAEDDKPIARVMNNKLIKSGFDVVVANNGEEALAAAENNGNFDLVILDIMMPKVDGFGVLEELKKKGVKTPVIITSNLSQKSDEKKARELGAKDYFVKSNISIMQIVDNVKKILKV